MAWKPFKILNFLTCVQLLFMTLQSCFSPVMGLRDMQTHNTCISEFRVYFTLCCLSVSDTLLSVLWRISANYKTIYIHHAQYCNNCNRIDYIRCMYSRH